MTPSIPRLHAHLLLGLALLGLVAACRGGTLPDGGTLLTKGCNADSSCASGVCQPSQHCLNCQLDAECAGASVCGTNVCSAPCTPAAGCGGGRTCCGGRCVEPLMDPASCGACGVACPATAFCGQGACQAALFRNLCVPGGLFVVQDMYQADNNAGRDMALALAAKCGLPAPVDQALAGSGAIDPDTGQPLLLTSVLVVGGGGFGQELFSWLQQHRGAPVVLGLTGGTAIYSRADGSSVVSMPMTTMGPSHDVFVVQVAHAAGSPLILSAYGYYAGGTTAASWYFVHRVLPTLATRTDAWMVVEWTDASGDGLPGETDRFVVLASGT